VARETDTDTALLRRARHDERVGERGDGVVS
jgi:hypothetical protein